MSADGAIILVGGGRMGGALLAGWLDKGGIAAGDLAVVEPDEATAARLRAEHGVQVAASPADVALDRPPVLVLFAVKPQIIGAVLPAYAQFALLPDPPVFLSIAAGATLSGLGAGLGMSAAIVRSMPNTPAAIGRGITVACPNAHVQPAMAELCTHLLGAVGDVAWIEDETAMDAVTAVSGSGPAYVFLLIECLADAGVAAGLEPALAERLARATVVGSGALAGLSDDTAATLRRNVTSPGGTTAAALEVLMADDGLAPLMKAAVRAATERSRALAAG